MTADPGQRAFDFNPIEATPEECERSRRLAMQWTLEEAAEDFHQLPGETMTEFYTAREEYLRALETFGPDFVRGVADRAGRAPTAPCSASTDFAVRGAATYPVRRKVRFSSGISPVTVFGFRAPQFP